MLCRIASAMPHLGDPFLIPLAQISYWYELACDARQWLLGIDETEEQEAERVRKRRARWMKLRHQRQ